MNEGHQPRIYQWVLLALAVIIFVTLTISVVTDSGWLQTFDHTITRSIRFFQAPWKTLIITWYTTFFNTVPLLIILAVGLVILLIEHYYREALFFFVTPVAGMAINHVIKSLIARPRPQMDVLMYYGGYSFPSGHASSAALILGSIMILISSLVIVRWQRWTINIILLVLILAVGYSRIYVGVHYPSDVLAGFCLGYIVLFIGQTAFGFQWVRPRRS